MLKILKTFILKNKWDIINIFIIMLSMSILSFFYWGKLGHFIIDSGREAYISSAVLKGKVLFKDILNIYGPLAYQINAILFYLFGESLNTLYIAGLFNAFVVVYCIYWLLRQFIPEVLSLAGCLLIIIMAVFSPGYCCNFFFPYSYSTYYSLTFLLLSLIFLFSYMKNDEKKFFLPLSFFMFGICLDCKIEFALFALVLLFVAIYLKPAGKKQFIISVLMFTIAPLLSLGVLFLQGMKLNELVWSVDFIYKYVNTPSMMYFFKFLGIYPDKNFISDYLPNNLQAIILLVTSNYIIYFSLQLIEKFSFEKLITIAVLTLIFQQEIFHFSLLGYFDSLDPGSTHYFIGWMGLSCILILVVQLIHYFKTKDKTLNDKLFIILVLSSLLINRSFILASSDNYGNYTFPLVLAVNLIFLTRYIPMYFKSIDFAKWCATSTLIIILSSIFIGFSYLKVDNDPQIAYSRVIPINTSKGIIYAQKNEGNDLINTINYINAKFPKNAKFVMYPEGPMLNFLTDRGSDDVIHTLIPPAVEVLGENYVIKRLLSNPPDYIIINGLNSYCWGQSYFGINYAQRVMKFIQKEYSLEKTFNESFNIRIYKIRNKKPDPN